MQQYYTACIEQFYQYVIGPNSQMRHRLLGPKTYTSYNSFLLHLTILKTAEDKKKILTKINRENNN